MDSVCHELGRQERGSLPRDMAEMGQGSNPSPSFLLSKHIGLGGYFICEQCHVCSFLTSLYMARMEVAFLHFS
jgi:hypothetical protein